MPYPLIFDRGSAESKKITVFIQSTDWFRSFVLRIASSVQVLNGFNCFSFGRVVGVALQVSYVAQEVAGIEQ